MTVSPGLIPAKLHRPPLRPEFVARSALVARLDQGLEDRVTLVTAPAGYGKSTLVAQWLASASAPPSAWLSLDALDSDPERLLRYLVATLRTIDPGCLGGTEDVLSAQTLPPPEHLAETVAADLDGVGRAVLVLDDYAVIRGEAVHELIHSMVPRLPDTLHLVIVSRVDPPLPLGLWRTRFWLHELRGGDLRFSRDEVNTLFHAPDAVHLSDDAIARLHDKTEGWIAGLRLAMMSLSEAVDPEARVRVFSGSDRLIMDYLMEEVLATKPPEIREFLAVTAPLERFCAPLCDELLGARPDGPDSRQALDWLYRHNVFLFPLGARDGWYRYHHLFRQLLLDRLHELLPGRRREEISQRAGTWFAREGWIEEGLQYLVAAGDLDGAADLVAEHLTAAINRDLSRRPVARWLAMFPADAVQGRLPLIVATLYIMIIRSDFDGMLRLLHEAYTTCRNLEGERYRRWWRELEPDLDTLEAYARYWAGDIPGAQKHAQRALASSRDPRSYQQSLAVIYHGATLALMGRRSDYVRFLEGQTREEAAGGAQFGPYLVARACVHFYHGELDECRDAALRMTPAGTAAAVPKYWQGIGYYLLGTVAYERDLLDEAEAHFRAVESLRFDSAPMLCHHGLIGLARVSLARGDHESAGQRAAAARRYALDTESPLALRDAEWFDRRLALATGEIRTSRFPRPRVPDFMRVTIDVPSQIWAWLQLADPAPDGAESALAFIDGARRQAETYGVEYYLIQSSILRAIALDRLGRREEAVVELESAVRRAEPHGLVRSFVDRGPMVRELLLEVAQREPDAPYVERLLAAFAAPADGVARDPVDQPAPGVQAAGAAGSRGPTSGELFTNRELDVLELLQQRLTNKEIAARLSVTAETVRKHTQNIYHKLGVHGRRQAVAAGITRGILTPP